MGTVSNPATFSSIKAAFGGTSNNFSDYYRGGSIVPSTAPSQISTTAAGLAMSQFNGVSSAAPLTSTPSTTSVIYGTTLKGTWTMGTVTMTASGGSGTYTYTLTYVSGDVSNDTGTKVTGSMSGNVATFKLSNINARLPVTLISTWNIATSDGTNTVNSTITVDAS